MRSAASLSATPSRAIATSGVIAPPNTTIPAGAPRAESQTGKRCSRGMIKALPSGAKPIRANSRRLPITSHRPARANGVRTSSTPRIPSAMMRFDGAPRKPRIFEKTKNMDRRGADLGRRDAEALIAMAQPRHQRNWGQHHPGLPDDLAQEEFERAEGKPQEHDRVDNEADHARGNHGRNQPPAGERRIDREIGELREQERHCRR